MFQDYCQLSDFDLCIYNEVEIMQKYVSADEVVKGTSLPLTSISLKV